MRGEVGAGAQGRTDRDRHQRRVAHGGEPYPEHAGVEVGDHLRCRFDAQSCLPGPAGSCERDQTGAVAKKRYDLVDLAFPADERARGARQVRVRDRLERWEHPLAELEDLHGLVEVLEAVLTEIDQLGRPTE